MLTLVLPIREEFAVVLAVHRLAFARRAEQRLLARALLLVRVSILTLAPMQHLFPHGARQALGHLRR
jgi:hypothetical protein